MHLSNLKHKMQFERKSRMDGLTGVYCKMYTENLCAAYIERIEKNTCCAVMIIDIDNFNNINDTYGHQYGDLTLRLFGKC